MIQPSSFDGVVDVDYAQRASDDPSRAGGDVVCVNYAPDGSALIGVVDLAVKADAAARQAEVVRKALRIGAARGYSARLAMMLLDAALRAHGDAHQTWLTFGTAFVLKCSTDGGVAYAAAGAEPAILFRKTGEHEHFGVTGPLVGLDQEWIGTEAHVSLAHGDSIVAYTDGVTESRSAANHRAFLGTSGLVSMVRRSIVDGEILSCHTIMEAVETWNQGRFLDDTTLLVVGRCPNWFR